jgi:hypothetical protein
MVQLNHHCLLDCTINQLLPAPHASCFSARAESPFRLSRTPGSPNSHVTYDHVLLRQWDTKKRMHCNLHCCACAVPALPCMAELQAH